MKETRITIQNDVSNEEIKNLIYTIRGKQVMLDSDVAMLYHYETKRINETVNRNKERFPENFCFQLTEDEFKNLEISLLIDSSKIENNMSQFMTNPKNTEHFLRSQNATLEKNTGRGRYLTFLLNKE